MAHGNWHYVLHDCPAAMLLYILTAVVFAWNAAALAFGVTIEPGPLLTSRGVKWGGAIVLIVLVLANWVYRLSMGLT